MVSRPDRFCLNLEQVRETQLSGHNTNPAAEDKLPRGKRARTKLLPTSQANATREWCWSLWPHWPIEQLLSNDVSVIMRQKVDPAVLEPQVPQKCLHDAGLLKYGVVMRSLRRRRPRHTGGSHECRASASQTHSLPHPTLVPSRCCLLVCHWSQSPRNQARSLDETSGSDLPKSTRKKEMIWLLWSCASSPPAYSTGISFRSWLSKRTLIKGKSCASTTGPQMILFVYS